MLDIGIDFGSTYTMVSVYRHDLKKPETVALEEGGNAAIPTVYACKSDGSKPMFGWAAKDNASSSVRKFRAFKMMLSEDGPAEISASVSRGIKAASDFPLIKMMKKSFYASFDINDLHAASNALYL